jgi:ribosomal-protein-alanine N-acetyltransferase
MINVNGEYSLTLRYLNINDAKSLEELDKLCFSTAVRFNRYDLVYYLSLKQAIGLAKIIDEHLHGFVIAVRTYEDIANVVTLDVHPKSRRHSIGSELIQELKVVLKENTITKITLQVAVDNHAAIKFYQKHGFKITNKLRGYYPTTDGLQMVCILE